MDNDADSTILNQEHAAQFELARQILATCPETNPSLANMLLKSFLRVWNKEMRDIFTSMIHSHSSWSPGNDWAGLPDYYMYPRHRTPLHGALHHKHPRLGTEIHIRLFYLASGYGIADETVVTPRYFRNIVGTAYHASYVDESFALIHWKTVLEIDKAIRDDGLCLSGGLSFSFLASQMLGELKELGRFAAEPITDEIIARVKKDKQPPWMDDTSR